MAIDPNILLQGIVPDLAGSIQRGLSVGRQIKEGPARNKLLDLQVGQQERLAESQNLEQGVASSLALSNFAGDDLTQEDLLNPETYTQLTRVAKEFGIPVRPEREQFSTQNAQDLYKVVEAGRQAKRASRGGNIGFTEGEVVTRQVGTDNINGQEVPIFQDFQTMNKTDSSGGTFDIVEKPITDTYTQSQGSPLLARKVTFEGAKEASKQAAREQAAAEAAEAERKRAADKAAAVKKSMVTAEQDALLDTAESRRDRESRDKKAGVLAKDAAEASTQAFDTAGLLNSQIGTFETAIEAIDEGAETGFISQFLPNAKASTIKLQSAINQSGLDAISLVTLGAISKGELDLVLKVGIPDNMNEDELKPFLEDKVSAMRKVQGELRRMGDFLSEGTNTLADWNGANNSNVKLKSSAKSKPALNKKDRLQELKNKNLQRAR